MHPILLLILVIAALYTVSWLKRQPPEKRREAGFKAALAAGGVVLLLATLTGKLNVVSAAVAAAIPLMQRVLTAKSLFDQIKSARGPAKGNRSEINTRFIEMSLDHDSGAMDGRVNEGRFKGQRLADLSRDDLMALLAECAVDAQSAAVLEAWLDRHHGPSWREGATGGAGGNHAANPGPMTPAEAREILGVAGDAGRDAILAAHRRLMQKVHPDRGGSDYLAAKINQAKDLLLG